MSKTPRRKAQGAPIAQAAPFDHLHTLRLALECGVTLSDEMRADLLKILDQHINATRRGAPVTDAAFRMAYAVDCLVGIGIPQKAAVIAALGKGATPAAVDTASRNYRRLRDAGSLDDPHLIFTKLPPADQGSGHK